MTAFIFAWMYVAGIMVVLLEDPDDTERLGNLTWFDYTCAALWPVVGPLLYFYTRWSK